MKKTTVPIEVQKQKKEVATKKYATLEKCTDIFYSRVKKIYDETDFMAMRCSHSWWIENNIVAPLEYFKERKGERGLYGEEELTKTFNLLLDITNLYNGKTRYQPNVISFCRMLDISTTTWNNWSFENNDRGELVRKITDYFKTILTQGMANGEINPVAGQFIGKTMLGMKESDGNNLNINIIGGELSVSDIMEQYKKQIAGD